MAELNCEPGKTLPNSFRCEFNGKERDVPFMLYVPESYDSEKAVQGDLAGEDSGIPLVFFLHGLGESGAGGNELERVTVHGPLKRIKNGHPFPFVVVAPQCEPPGEDKSTIRAAWKAPLLLRLLDHVIAQLKIDEDRVYLTGLSMGGFGSWRLAAAAPERFAALVPICGGGESEYGLRLTDLPIWAFHGQLDQVVSVSMSEEMVEHVREAGGDAKLTTYENAHHDSWTETYENEALYKWLLSKRRHHAPQNP